MASATDHKGILAVGLEDILQPRLDLILCMAYTLSVHAQASADMFQVAHMNEGKQIFSMMTFENGVHEKRTMILKNGGCMCPAVHQRCASAHGVPEPSTVTKERIACPEAFFCVMLGPQEHSCGRCAHLAWAKTGQPRPLDEHSPVLDPSIICLGPAMHER